MSDGLSDEDLHGAFSGAFNAYCAEDWAREWRSAYVAAVERVHRADEATWLDPAFQRTLWEDNSVASIGPGISVTVTSAYAETDLAARLFKLRNSISAGADLAERGAALQAAYDEILARVYPTHTPRRPKARLIRLLALLFPHDMTCLMDASRVWSVQRLIGATRLTGDFVAQHAALRQRIRDAVGEPEDIAAEVDQSIFAWFLWDTRVKRADEGAITFDGGSRKAHYEPAISLLPANAQRRSLMSVRDNVNLLVAVVREAEQGISREDLANVILSEAPQLNASSVGNIISQAQGGLGLIQLESGAYRPTERGLELLTAANPAEVLRAPLVGRVFGMGHLLRMIASDPAGLAPTDAARRLQTLVPTWTTTQPGSHIVTWANVTGLVQADAAAGGRLRLTEDGEAYAAALPDDFEERWSLRLTSTAAASDADVSDEAPHPAASDEPAEAYDVHSIVAEGCFLAPEEIAGALALLRRRKNLVLQGPPGTGKSWLAKRLGYALIGALDPSRLIAVQFQPSLSYEDFVRGWRPDGAGGLKLADGVFLDAVYAARSEPTRPFVLVIEEINRGNPAQILGELLTLLETDKRNEAEALRLAYPRTLDERVYVPKNLYVIGTMNLADRSLALVDLALRRRFAFLTLEPKLNEAWRAWCRALGATDAFLEEISNRLGTLNREIKDDRALGPQFKIGHSFVVPPETLKDAPPDQWRAWFNDVVETEIGPLLAEYWYDDRNRAAEKAKALRLES